MYNNNSLCKECIYGSFDKHFLSSVGFRKCSEKVNYTDISQGKIIIDSKTDSVFTRGVLECSKFKEA